MQLIRGQALLHLHKPTDALAELEPAERWLAQREPWAHAEVLMVLGAAYRDLHHFAPALAAHARAVEAFRHHHDADAAAKALGGFCATLRTAGAGPRATRRIRRAISRSPSE
jgi:hypothetical protein